MDIDVFLNQKDVCTIVKLCREQIWKLEKRGEFPKRIKLGVRCIRWRKSDIEKFIAAA